MDAMSLYSDYTKERFGWSTIEVEGGFIVYEIDPPNCTIHEFYVKPELRGTRLAKDLADQVVRVAQERGVKSLWGVIDPTTEGAENALRTNLHYGFKLIGSEKNRIVMMKNIGEA
jgi:GNAT superfamily N-acetyltransferase